MEFPNVLQLQSGRLFSVHGIVAGCQGEHFGGTVLDDQDCIEPLAFREIGDQVY